MIRKRIILIPLLLAAVFACQKLPDDNGAQPSGEKTEQPEPLDASCELLSLKATASLSVQTAAILWLKKTD